MKNLKIAIISVGLLLFNSATASVTLQLGFGEISTSTSSIVPVGSLWALITENDSNILPGGLPTDGSFAVNTDVASILADFAGATIAPQNIVGGGIVVAVGQFNSDIPGFVIQNVNIDYTDAGFAALGLSSGDRFGFYWFPGLDLENNVLPSNSDFEIGGFHQTELSAVSGGETGMSLPSDGANVIISYLNSAASGSASFDPLFRAVLIPEPTTSLLLMTSIFLILRRFRL